MYVRFAPALCASGRRWREARWCGRQAQALRTTTNNARLKRSREQDGWVAPASWLDKAATESGWSYSQSARHLEVTEDQQN
jgi:hypothetical protein